MESKENTHKIICLTCGLPIDYTPGKKGRPPERHPECRKIEQLFSWMENSLSEFKGTEQAANDVRSRLWYLANLMNGKIKQAKKEV